MAKRSKYQAELLLRSLPPNAFDVLREVGTRLQAMHIFPAGVLPLVGQTIESVLTETNMVKGIRAEEKKARPIAVVEEA